MSQDGSGPSDTMVERSEDPSWKLWLLLNANRWIVSGVLMLFVFVGLVAVGELSPVSLRALMSRQDPVETLFQALVTSLITGVTLVVTINQLVLSQELGAVQDQRDRFAGAMEFREDVEDVIDAPISPPEPASFLQALVAASAEHAEAFRAAAEPSGDETFERRVEDFVDNLTEHADSIVDDLEDAQFGTYEVLKSALDYNYSWKIFRARRIERGHGDAFSDETREAFDHLLDSLELFGLAREHFKTLYFQWELINLSRAMMYVSLPALVVSISMIVSFDVSAASGTLFGVDRLIWIVALTSTIAVAPFVFLIAFVLRVATIAKRTLAIGPFILRESSRGGEFDMDD